MRRVGFALLGVGAFLLTMAALVKWYAYPQLAVVPLDQESVAISMGENVTYFSLADREEKTDTLKSTLRVIGDVAAAEAQGDDVAVWDKSTVTTNSEGVEISVETQRTAIDRTSGEAVNCCGENIDDQPVAFDGLVFKFPFNTQQQTYTWFDADLRQGVPIEFQGAEEIDGLEVYRFSHTIEPTQIGTRDIPGNLLGEDPTKVLTAEQWYANTRTLWVEPQTGAIIDAEEELNSTFRYDGSDRIVVTRGTTGYDEAQVAANVDEYTPKASQLMLLRVFLPIGGLVLGLVLLLLGIGMAMRGREAASA